MKILDILNNLEKTLVVGWDSYNAPTPTPETYAEARKYIEKYGEEILTILPISDGGLCLMFVDKEIELYNDGEVCVDEFDGEIYVLEDNFITGEKVNLKKF